MNGPKRQHDEKLKALLRKDREQGVKAVNKDYKDRVTAIVRDRVYYMKLPLQDSDLEDCWQETLMALNRQVKAGIFSPEGSLFSWLVTVMWRRCLDRLSKKAIRLYIDASSIAEESTSQDELEDLHQVINDYANRLDDHKRVILLTEVRLFPEEFKWASDSELTGKVNEQLGTTYGVGAIRAERYRVRNKLQNYLQERGYNVPGKRKEAG